MQTHADKDQSSTGHADPQRSDAAFQFVDQRPAASAQSRLNNLAEAGPQATQLHAIQARADASPSVAAANRLSGLQTPTTQRQEADEEEPLQGKFGTVQRQEAEEEEEPMQGKFATVQRQAAEEDELQMKAVGAPEQTTQLQAEAAPRKNETGLPDKLKSGIESLSGISMDNVRVHYNSSKPAQLNAYAYAQGTDIHVGPGQEKHLPHEAWHVVQQAQGRVSPTMQMKGGVLVNADAGLEGEADLMGGEALSALEATQLRSRHGLSPTTEQGVGERSMQLFENASVYGGIGTIQRATSITHENDTLFYYDPDPAGGYLFNGQTYNECANAGSAMEAELDKFDPKQGSGTGGGDVVPAAADTTVQTGTPFVAGHLLNGGLGGLGIDANMVPISAHANALHSGLEQNIKQTLARQFVPPAPGAGYIHYRVEVLDSNGTVGGDMASDQDTDCTLLCSANYVGGATIFDIEVPSEVGGTNLGPAWGQLGNGRRALGTPGRVNFVNNVVTPLGTTITNPVTGMVMHVAPTIEGAFIQNDGTWMSFKHF